MKGRLGLLPGALWAGAIAGILGLVLVLRLNPDVEASARTFLLGVPLWMSWGAFIAGIPLWLISVVVARPCARLGMRRGEAAGALLGAMFLLAALTSWVNAEIHTEFQSATGLRQLRQDATMWLAGAVFVALAMVWWHRNGRRRRYASILLLLSFLMPVLRLAGEPTTFHRPEEIAASPLGHPGRPLLVCGINGLDPAVILDIAATRSFANLDRLTQNGAWGAMDPFRPYLEQAYWATLATGVLPRSHGVMFRWGWQYPAAFDGTLRLLPWTPKGSRLFLAWDRGLKVEPPPSAIPPVWHRLIFSDVDTEVISWHGMWEAGAGVQTTDSEPTVWSEDPSLQSHLEGLLNESFPDHAPGIVQAIRQDEARILAALTALDRGTSNVWLVLDSLAEGRRLLEPHRSMDATHSEFKALMLELLDEQVGRLLRAVPENGLTAVVSPNGLAPPDPGERILRLIGMGGQWRASAETCPDGLFVLLGEGVAKGERFPAARLEDFAPTLCYLLDLPVAQYMEGRVILEAIDPDWLSQHPLRVVD